MKKLILLSILLIVGCASAPNKTVSIKGLNDELETKISISTYEYSYPNSAGIYYVPFDKNDPFFRAFIDKKTKSVTLQLYVKFNSYDWIFWDNARLKISDEIVTVQVDRVDSEVFCPQGSCNHYEDVVMTIEKEWLENWALSGKTIRFASTKSVTTQDVIIDIEEAKAFLDEVDNF